MNHHLFFSSNWTTPWDTDSTWDIWVSWNIFNYNSFVEYHCFTITVVIFLSPELTVTEEEETRRQNWSSKKKKITQTINKKPVTEGRGIPYQIDNSLYITPVNQLQDYSNPTHESITGDKTGSSGPQATMLTAMPCYFLEYLIQWFLTLETTSAPWLLIKFSPKNTSLL